MKNLLKNFTDKPKKALLALSLAGALVASLAGCSGSLPDTNKDSAAPKPAASAASKLCDPTNDTYGGSVAHKEVKDELGKYCQTAINPKSEALKRDVSKYYLASFEENGITEDQAYEAQKSVVGFIASQALDSTTLDNNNPGTVSKDANAVKWFTANSSLFSSNVQNQYNASGDVVTSGVILTGNFPHMVRNGEPRINKTLIEVTSVLGGKSTIDGKPQISVNVSFKSSYKATNAITVKWLSTGRSEAEVRVGAPELFTAEADKTDRNILATGKLSYAVDPDSFKIIGTDLTKKYRAELPDGVALAEYESLVVIPRVTLASAKNGLPNG